MTITASIDLTAINAKLDKITAAAAAATRPAAQAGAQVLYEEVRQRASTAAGGTEKHSSPGNAPFVQSGTLRDAIYQAYADDESGDARSVYRVSWNKRKAPHGGLLERGTSRMAARPFLRPGYDAARQRALSTAQQVLAAQVRKELPP